MEFYVVFSGNNLNDNQMNRNYGNIDQMERNVVHKHEVNSLQPLNSSEMSTASNIAALKSTIPTTIPKTIDGLIEYIAINGDDFEEKIVAKIAQMNERTLFR